MKTNTIRIKQRKQTKIDKTAKIMLVGTGLCCLAPFLYIFSMQMSASTNGMNIMQLVESNPLINLNMIVAFLNPFVGYLLFLSRKRLLAFEDFESVYLNLAILMIAQIFSMNLLYLCLCAYVLYKAMAVYDQPFKKAFQAVNRSFIGKELGGSILVCCFFIFIALLTLRLNFIA